MKFAGISFFASDTPCAIERLYNKKVLNLYKHGTQIDNYFGKESANEMGNSLVDLNYPIDF